MVEEEVVAKPDTEQLKDDCLPNRSIRDLILYKMDRTFAVLGIILIGCWSMAKAEIADASVQIAFGAVTALATYIGGRTGTK